MVKRVNSLATLAKLSMNSMINQNDDLDILEEFNEGDAIEDLKKADGHVKIYDVSLLILTIILELIFNFDMT